MLAFPGLFPAPLPCLEMGRGVSFLHPEDSAVKPDVDALVLPRVQRDEGHWNVMDHC